ncbi:hypothetical protein PsorP6_016415 [Peronosclerospora sorghi]|uniref:Uncharacterized protein n=1 Tax=Peronosclerospora sorghi TaxID=230839 RepID=A0ACC0VRU2_9STRA|nr:hypothetical protein PsorP6_016415 [Peronosclerospora sorghi]
MDDVSLQQKQTDDKELDHLIFDGNKDESGTNENQPQTHDGDSDDSDDKAANATKGDRTSLNNVLPVDKLKNGANTASKVLGQTISMFKEKSGAALEAAKASNAGKVIADGINNAANASQEQYGKLKESDAFKKSSNMASGAYERTSLVASGALEKVSPVDDMIARAASTSGLEKAKTTAAAGIETIKSKTGKKGGEN